MPELRVNKDTATLYVNDKFGRRITSEKFFEKVTPREMIPVSMRWFDPIQKIYVLEYPPERRLIFREYGEQAHSIPVPWQVYICSVEPLNVRMFMRTEQLTSLGDTLYHQFMSNVYRNGTPCNGARLDPHLNDADDITKCRAMIDAIWMTTFNGGTYISSYSSNLETKEALNNRHGQALMPKELVQEGFDKEFWSYANNEPTFFDFMEEKSIEEVLEWNYHPAGTVNELIDHLKTRNGDRWEALSSMFIRSGSETIRE